MNVFFDKEMLGEIIEMKRALTISVYPSPPMLSANSIVSLLSLYGMCPPRFFGSPKAAMQFPVKP